MKLTFLGTGAADWDINQYDAMPEFRRFSSALVNNDLLIDPGPHVFHFAEKNGTPDLLDGVKNIIVTHSHGDHFCPETVAQLCEGRDCIIWCAPECMKVLNAKLGNEAALGIQFRSTEIGKTYEIGEYRITPLRANHFATPGEITRVYLIERDGRILFYGCDSAWLPTETWNFMRELPINTLVMELTCGEIATYDWRIFEHNTPEMLEIMLTMFKKYNRFAPDVKYYVSHMARTLHGDHASVVRLLAPMGVTPAYDGMQIEI